MPLRQTGHLQYNFTEQETKYLLNDNTCVIDNLVGLYGKELKLNRNKIIKLNKEFHGFVDEEDEPEFIESDLGDLIVNPNYNNELKDAEAKLKKYEDEYNKIKQTCAFPVRPGGINMKIWRAHAWSGALPLGIEPIVVLHQDGSYGCRWMGSRCRQRAP
jgi:hypothetical protein